MAALSRTTRFRACSAGSIRFLGVVLILGLALPAPCGADSAPGIPATLYVDGKAAPDSATGARNKPFATIQAALDVAEPGTRIFVKAGVYDETLQLKQSGTEQKAILVEGERGPDGRPLATIRAGQPIANWQPAPEIGQGVYKVTGLGFSPLSMETGDGRNLDCVPEGKGNPGTRDHDVQPCMGDGSAWRFFTSDGDFECTADNPEHAIASGLGKVKFWDVTYGIFGTAKGVTYVRLKDRSDPNLLKLRASDRRHSIRFQRKSYTTFKGFKVAGCAYGFTIQGPESHHIVIQDNVIVDGGAGAGVELIGGVRHYRSLCGRGEAGKHQALTLYPPLAAAEALNADLEKTGRLKIATLGNLDPHRAKFKEARKNVAEVVGRWHSDSPRPSRLAD